MRPAGPSVCVDGCQVRLRGRGGGAGVVQAVVWRGTAGRHERDGTSAEGWTTARQVDTLRVVRGSISCDPIQHDQSYD